MIDSHAHLNFKHFRRDLPAVLERARAAGVRAIVTIGCDLPSSEAAVRLAHEHAEIYAVVGVHPHDAKTLDSAALSRLETLAHDPRVVAIGEIGLDYYRDLSPRHLQEQAFRDQIGLARRADLPVVVHDRDAHAKVMQILKEEQVSRGVLHCFSGDVNMARQAIQLGFYLSFAGPVTYDGSRARDVIGKIPVDRILIETDCPYLAPVPFRGKRNEPAYVKYVLEHLAGAIGLPVDDLDRITEENTRTLFGLKP
ncbi:MAG TPA: TatD family hydrolase [bacterium]|nr:TatD family hydrolase [bacterium]